MAGNGKQADKREPQTIDGNSGRPDPTPPKLNLSNLRDVRLEMAAVYRDVKRGTLDSRDGSRRVYILRQIGDILAITELERRVEQLENQRGPHAGALSYQPEQRH